MLRLRAEARLRSPHRSAQQDTRPAPTSTCHAERSRSIPTSHALCKVHGDFIFPCGAPTPAPSRGAMANEGNQLRGNMWSEPPDSSPEGAANDSPGRKSGVKPKERNRVPEG